jgi:CelD/BcsL family acetyltransferase involved in cellulose biosynthesis
MKRIRSYERKMQREGDSVIRHFRAPEGEELRSMLEDCAAIEIRSWLVKTEEGRPRFAAENSLRFWEYVCANQLVPNGQLDVWVAYFNQQPVAFRFSIETGSISYMIANQYDEQVAPFRIGWILYLRDLEECARRGVRSIDMGDGDLHYKSRWGGREEAMRQDVLVFPPGPLGYLGATMISFGPLYQRAQRFVSG